MNINRASVFSLAIPLTVPYTIAYVTISDTVNHFLVLENSDGVQGIGCAAPAPDVTGETPDMSLAALERIAAFFGDGSTVLQDSGFSPLEHPSLRGSSGELNWSALATTPSAMTALDMALADLSARTAGQTCAQWMTGHNADQSDSISDPARDSLSDQAFHPVTTSVTIGISSVVETVERARLLLSEGFHFLKIKGGHDVVQDVRRLERLRGEFGPSLYLALDANQGYAISDVELLEQYAAKLKLSYLEQPTPKSDLKLLGMAAKATSIPVMADEAVQTEEDARRIGDLQTVRLINIKLQKMGGFKASSRIDAIAREAGMGTMLGCMDESAISIAAALQFGAAHPNVIFYDLDGHLDLSEDPFDGLVDLDRGRLSTSVSEGLGWMQMPAF